MTDYKCFEGTCENRVAHATNYCSAECKYLTDGERWKRHYDALRAENERLRAVLESVYECDRIHCAMCDGKIACALAATPVSSVGDKGE